MTLLVSAKAHLAVLLLPTAVVMALQPHSSLCSVCFCAVADNITLPAAPAPLCSGSSLDISDVCSWTAAVPAEGEREK